MTGWRRRGRALCATVEVVRYEGMFSVGRKGYERLELRYTVRLACGYERTDDLAYVGRRLNCDRCEREGHLEACREANRKFRAERTSPP